MSLCYKHVEISFKKVFAIMIPRYLFFIYEYDLYSDLEKRNPSKNTSAKYSPDVLAAFTRHYASVFSLQVEREKISRHSELLGQRSFALKKKIV